ncbi:hypothetical protein [Burkholderia cenocepacia]|uniref:hypothetical protein n=1 Tax=Burkholderia cenocepacia TaxID=95486 RepID=UPI0022321F4B|nr:hypothetical protein [Burkholderia cenocepacia]
MRTQIEWLDRYGCCDACLEDVAREKRDEAARGLHITANERLAVDPLFIDTETNGLDHHAAIVGIAILDRAGTVLIDTLVKPAIPMQVATASVTASSGRLAPLARPDALSGAHGANRGARVRVPRRGARSGCGTRAPAPIRRSARDAAGLQEGARAPGIVVRGETRRRAHQ